MSGAAVERLAYSVAEVAAALGLSDNAVYELLDDGVLPELPRINRRRLIPRRALDELVDAAMDGFDAKATVARVQAAAS